MNFKVIQFTDNKYYVTRNGQVYSVKNLKYLRRDISHSYELRVLYKSEYDYRPMKKYLYNILIANGFYKSDNIPPYTHKSERYQNVNDVNILTDEDASIEVEILKHILQTNNPNANIEKVKLRLKELEVNK